MCPDLEVFVSSSLDGTVCIWNKENHLTRLERSILIVCEKNTVTCSFMVIYVSAASLGSSS